VVAARIETQSAQELPVLGEDPHVEICNESEDSDSGMSTTQPDVVQSAVVAKGDAAVAVDAIPAYPAVVGNDQSRAGRERLRPGLERFSGCTTMKGSVGTADVVVVAEPVELRLELPDARHGRLLSEPPLLGLVEPLDLAAGLRVVGRGVMVAN